MQRPVMHPNFEEEVEQTSASRRAQYVEWLKKVCRLTLKLMLASPMALRRRKLKIDDGLTTTQRLLRGLMYRIMLMPVLVMIAVGALVYVGTHPRAGGVEIDPVSQGIYYDPVNFLGDDGARLEGWLVPVLDAKRIVAEGDRALHKKWPAVVLVHGFGQSRQQVLPLVKPLHDEGWVVLAVACRATSTNSPLGQTFGLSEVGDVRAAVEMLRRSPFVDAGRIAVVGIGTGANAAVLVADRDPNLAALVLDGPLHDPDDPIRKWVAPKAGYLYWMEPLCRWGFELMYGVDVIDLKLSRFDKTLDARPSLVLDDEGSDVLSHNQVNTIRQFLRGTLRAHEHTASVAQ